MVLNIIFYTEIMMLGNHVVLETQVVNLSLSWTMEKYYL